MSYKILMFGWEFPPHNSGGLGVACQGIVRALYREGNTVHFVLPRSQEVTGDADDFLFANIDHSELFDTTMVESALYSPYLTREEYQKHANKKPGSYGRTLLDEVYRYGQQGKTIAESVEHDVIHAHDWLSFPAAIAAQQASGKPLVAHVHATECDRTGGNGVDERVYAIEKQGMEAADRILAVSAFTKQIIVDNYGIPADKISVAHNGIDAEDKPELPAVLGQIKERGGKIVLFLGRITIQKGPDYFMEAAQKVSKLRDDAYFVVAGSGSMQDQMIEQAARLGIADRVFFPGFVRGQKIDQLYQSADLFVMPSVSEPFGITPLEAMMNKTPILISKQSGVSEVVNHALTVDFWDTDRMADYINAVLEHPELYETLRTNGHQQVHNIKWEDTAKAITASYEAVMAEIGDKR